MEREKEMLTKTAGPPHEAIVQEDGGSSCAVETFEGGNQTVVDHQPSDLRLIATVAASSASKQMAMQAQYISCLQDAAVLTVLGGKASCRRKFVLTLQLQDAHGHVVPRDLSIIASVAFANDHSPVRPPDAGEPPLFTTFNGIEFSAHDNPTRMLAGRATFKLAISLLSSKYENRLFCICFSPQTKPPLCPPCFSTPIRSISRKRTSAAPALHIVTDASHNEPSLSHLPHIYTGPHPLIPSHSPDHSSSDNTKPCSTGGLVHSGPIQQNSMNWHSRSNVGMADPHMHYHYGNGAKESNDPMAHIRSWPRNDDRLVDCLPPLSNMRHSAAAMLHQQNMTVLSSSSASTLGSSTIQNITAGRLNTPSPVDSGSPNSAFTSESCIDNSIAKDNRAHCVTCLLHSNVHSCATLQASTGRPLSAPSPPVSSARPLRPQASIGVCKVPFMHSTHTPNHEGSRVSRSLQDGQAAVANGIHANAGILSDRRGGAGDLIDEAEELQSRSLVVGVMQRLSSAAGLAMPVQQRLDALMRSFLSSSRNMSSSPLEDNGEGGHQNEACQLEEEERAIQCLELSLYEVSMEIQKHKEEVQLKRRRLLEEEARLNTFIFQSPSWINTLATKFTH